MLMRKQVIIKSIFTGHLRNSLEFYDSSSVKIALSTDKITGLLSDYQHGYYKISKDSDESTYSKVSIEIKNNLPNSTYSALFFLSLRIQ